MTQSFNPDKLSIYLKEQAKIIRSQSFDRNQIIRVLNNLNPIFHAWRRSGGHNPGNANLFWEAFFEFNLSLDIAYSNYRKENTNFWRDALGFGFSKVPQVDIKKLISK